MKFKIIATIVVVIVVLIAIVIGTAIRNSGTAVDENGNPIVTEQIQ